MMMNVTGCGNKGVIEENKFIRIYTDIIIARDTASVEPKNDKKILKGVFSRYNVTEKEYRETIDYYNKNPERWRKFFTKAIRYADQLKKKKSGI